uniref:Uncharacterized protein n=1 Tax=Glossina palpalis gambiensis TaxID=67801 RepID=A0A1B0BNC5_9MUSC
MSMVSIVVIAIVAFRCSTPAVVIRKCKAKQKPKKGLFIIFFITTTYKRSLLMADSMQLRCNLEANNFKMPLDRKERIFIGFEGDIENEVKTKRVRSINSSQID